MSELIDEIKERGYKNIKQLDEVIKKAEKAFKAYEKERPPAGEKGRRFADVGVVRVSLDIADEQFLEIRDLPEPAKQERREYRHLVE